MPNVDKIIEGSRRLARNENAEQKSTYNFWHTVAFLTYTQFYVISLLCTAAHLEACKSYIIHCRLRRYNVSKMLLEPNKANRLSKAKGAEFQQKATVRHASP